MPPAKACTEEKMTKSLDVVDKAKKLQSEIVELRRHLHQNPELSFHEFETAKLTAQKLEAAEFRVKKGVGKTGVIGDLGEGPVIAIRADMDALPIAEKNNTAYTSKHAGVMHACGHDAHVACAMATAKILAASGARLNGSIRMLMQPAEEFSDEDGKSGARRMIEDDAMSNVEAIIGLHMDGSMPAGKIGLCAGPMMAAVVSFSIEIYGKGGHGAFPETTIDAVILGTNVVQAIQQIVSRRVAATDPAIITIGSFQSSSTRGNVISEQVTLVGTFRTFDKEVAKKLRQDLESACSIARALGGDYKIHYDEGYPALVTDPKIVDVMRQAAIDIIGEENVITLKPKCWSEDFSMFAELAPAAFMFLGGAAKNVAHDPSFFPHHTPTFDIDESGLWIGSAILSETAFRLHEKLRQ
jgi:amidohydrolase